MSDIIYTYGNEVYANLTNHCDCNCTFCIRSNGDGLGSSDMLWFQGDPDLTQIKSAVDAFLFQGYSELVFCGYGEPTCALDNLIATAAYVKEKYHLRTRLNTNGLGNLYHGRNIVPDLLPVMDTISISLNAPTEEKYQQICRPAFPDALSAVITFASLCRDAGIDTKLTLVNVISPEEIEACQKIAEDLQIPLRVREFT